MGVFFRHNFNQSTLYKNITNDLTIQKVLAAQWIERPIVVRKVVVRIPSRANSFFFLLLLVSKTKTEVIISSFKPVAKVVVTDYCADP